MNHFKRLLTLLIPSVFLLFSHSVGFAQQLRPSTTSIKDTIIWKPGYTLKKEDYKGTSRDNIPVFSSIGVFMYGKERNMNPVMVVQCIFIKGSSFMTVNHPNILKHEQANFDLCEIYARRLRKKIATVDPRKSKDLHKVMNDLYMKTNMDYAKEREAFEKETQLGMDQLKQKLWLDKINMDLKSLSAYANADVELQLNFVH